MKTLIILLLLIPTFSLGEQILKCNVKGFEELFGDHYYSLENNQISYIPKDGNPERTTWKLEEENKIFANFVFRSSVDNSLISQLIINKASLEMKYTVSRIDDESFEEEQLVCSIIK